MVGASSHRIILALTAMTQFKSLFSIFFIILVFATVASCNSHTSETNTAAQPATPINPNGRNDAWGYAGFGGGGAMFYPAVSYFNPDIAMVACDMTGSFVTFNGGNNWRMFNLRGPVQYFCFDPLDSNTVYANSIALFKSSDKGNTWQVLYPDSSNILSVISRGDHANEMIITRDSSLHMVQAFAIDPANSKKLYAAIAINQKPGFYISDDAGLHWKKETDLHHKAQNIFIVPGSDRNEIFITTAAGVMAKTRNGWQQYAPPASVKKLTTYTGGYDSVSAKFIMYAISGLSYFNDEEDASGIYYSEDGGKTWENREAGIRSFQTSGSVTPEWRTIATSALHPSTVYVSYNNLQMSDITCIGVARSTDYGRTWSLVWQDHLYKNGSTIAKNFSEDWLNERFGPTWGENPFSIGVAPSNPDICYATDFGRTIKTMDGGKTWQQVYSIKENKGWRSRGLEVTTSYQVATDPFDSNHVFICNTDIGLMESTDGAHSWISATNNNGVPREWVNSTYWLTFDPALKGRVWAVMSANHDLPRPKMWRRNAVAGYRGGILQSDDAGKSWKPISKAIGEAAFTHILIDLKSDPSSRTLWACAFGKGVYKSTDGGKTWALKNRGIQGREPFAWRITRRESDGTLFLIVSRRSEKGEIGNMDDGVLYRSDDGGEQWTSVTLPEGTNAPTSVVTDAGNPKHLLLSAWGRIQPGTMAGDTGGGIYFSANDGQSWQPVLQHDQHIHDISYDTASNTYYACGFNSSAYRSTDNGLHWQRIPGYNFKWGKRVEPDPVHPGMVYIITFGGGVWYGPAGGDSTAVEDITSPILSYK